ncbi:conserved exported hypothetical protein [Burkholderiales bacterium]|jgi:hypothetical protein|nr:conserved exported hypothetical protein [Burkholderiales bacterium]
MKTRNLRARANCDGASRGPGRWVVRVLAALALSLATGLSFAGDEVAQPIEFPHDIHAGKMGINCMYCHTYARRSRVSGIPPLRKCIGCHQSIESVKDKPRIKKLFEYWEKKEAIPFKKVNDLPDFVRFSHERHIQRFYFQLGRPVEEVCGYCHGNVRGMTVDVKVEPLTMGWCVACHQKDHPNGKPGVVVDPARVIYPRMETADRPAQLVIADTSHGPNDCWQCHK